MMGFVVFLISCLSSIGMVVMGFWINDEKRKRRAAEMLMNSHRGHLDRRQQIMELEETRLKNLEGRLKAREHAVKAVEMLRGQMSKSENAQELIDYLVNRDGTEQVH